MGSTVPTLGGAFASTNRISKHREGLEGAQQVDERLGREIIPRRRSISPPKRVGGRDIRFMNVLDIVRLTSV